MRPILRRLSLVAAAAAGAFALAARAEEAPRLDWQLDRWDGRLQFSFSYRTDHGSSTNSHPADIAQFAGLTDAQLASPTLTTVRFAIRRDAGDFDCDGSARAERASGTCDFHANLGFSALLKARGIGAPDNADLFQLAYEDIGRAYLEELGRQRYATPSLDDLRHAGQHGVTLSYLRDLDAAGYRASALPELSRLRDHGVTIGFIQGLKAAGYAHPSLDELVEARDHGVSAEFARGLADLGYRGAPIETLVRLRDHGVTAGFAAALADQGYRALPLETLVRMRDHGVTAGFAAQANAEAAPAGQRLAPDELIRLRDTGGLYRATARRDR